MTKINMTQAPLILPKMTVLPEWLDYNGHMNVAFYVKAFDDALEYVWEGLGMGADYIKNDKNSGFTVEMHICYIRELREGDELAFTFQLINRDAKRLHCMMQMFHAEKKYLAATCEQMAVHVNMETRRVSPYPDNIKANIDALMKAHADLPHPPQIGKIIGMRKPA